VERKELIDMLNQDLADEHVSIIRYLVHAYQVGEDTPFGSMLLSTAREEMWHMNWLGDLVGELGGEPRMDKGVYPHDPSSNASLLRSYIEWEKNLVEMYPQQAEQVDDPEIRRVLLQEGIESDTHRRRFEEWLEKLGPEAEEPFDYGEEGGFSPDMLGRFQSETDDHYKLILQHLRHAFVFEDESCPAGSELELTAMRHMKHLSYFAEELAESGQELAFDYPGVDETRDLKVALTTDLELTTAAQDRFAELESDPEIAQHPGLKLEVENMIARNEFLASVVKELLEEAEKHAEAADPSAQESDSDGDTDGFTVGSLMYK
jgi:bacterioferritin